MLRAGRKKKHTPYAGAAAGTRGAVRRRTYSTQTQPTNNPDVNNFIEEPSSQPNTSSPPRHQLGQQSTEASVVNSLPQQTTQSSGQANLATVVASNNDQAMSGTLGGFVTMDSGDIGFITSAHVFHRESGFLSLQEKFDVVQPSRGFSEPNVCGIHEKSFVTAGLFGGHTLDAALVKITSRKPTRGLFAGMTEEQLLDIGYSLQMLPEYDNGAIRDFRKEQSKRTHLCVKFGANSGLTRGMLWINGMSVRWNDNLINLANPSSGCEIKYFKQLQIIGLQNLSFAQNGDSGALVFQVDPDETNNQRLVCIGMIVGGTSDNKTVVTPIGPILEALNVKMHKFSTFEDANM